MPVRLPELKLTGEQLAELAQAVQILERIFPDHEVRIDRDHGPFGLFFNDRFSTIRDKVIASTAEKPLSVPEIAAATGLDQKRVRGVLNSPDLKFTRTKEDGQLRYRCESAMRSNYVPEAARIENLK